MIVQVAQALLLLRSDRGCTSQHWWQRSNRNIDNAAIAKLLLLALPSCEEHQFAAVAMATAALALTPTVMATAALPFVAKGSAAVTIQWQAMVSRPRW